MTSHSQVGLSRLSTPRKSGGGPGGGSGHPIGNKGVDGGWKVPGSAAFSHSTARTSSYCISPKVERTKGVQTCVPHQLRKHTA
jgi:hypothetical protein